MKVNIKIEKEEYENFIDFLKKKYPIIMDIYSDRENYIINISLEKEKSYEDITSFEDALEYFGLTEEEYIDSQKPHIIALQKLELIIKAINDIEEWQICNDIKQQQYYPTFIINDEKNQFRFLKVEHYENQFCCGRLSGRPTLGYYSLNIKNSLPLTLLLPSKEIATYVGKQFVDLWEKYIVNI